MTDKIYMVQRVEVVDGGFLPDNHRVVKVFSSLELAEEYCKRDRELNIEEWDVDEEEEEE